MLEIIIRVSRLLTGLSFITLIFAVTLQVVGRMSAGGSAVWTEELTRFALLYLAAFGAGLSFRSGDMVNVDIFSESLPGDWPRRMRLAAASFTALMCLGLLYPSWQFTRIGQMQRSTALGWRMDFIHASILVLILSLFVFSAARVIGMLRGTDDGLPMTPAGDDA